MTRPDKPQSRQREEVLHIPGKRLPGTIGHVIRPRCQERPGIDIALVGELTAAIDKRQTALLATPEGWPASCKPSSPGTKPSAVPSPAAHTARLFHGFQ